MGAPEGRARTTARRVRVEGRRTGPRCWSRSPQDQEEEEEVEGRASSSPGSVTERTQEEEVVVVER